MFAFVFFIQLGALTASAQPLDQVYESYLQKYRKSYPVAEKQQRFLNFKKNLQQIQDLNSRNLGFSLQVGPKTDWSSSDYSELPPPSSDVKVLQDSETPEFIDWVKKDKVSKVRTPEDCEASWVYAAVDTIESSIAITNNVPAFALSAQQFISCSGSFGNDGCYSGTLENSFKYAMSNVLCTESQYPFLDQPASCKRKFFCKNRIAGFDQLQRFNETQLKLAVSKQPVAVTLNLTSVLLNYEKGIISESDCGKSTEQAFFTIVGYGSIAGKDFWAVRTYWGESWGLGGHVLIERNDSNDSGPGACGVAFSAYVPSLSQ